MAHARRARREDASKIESLWTSPRPTTSLAFSNTHRPSFGVDNECGDSFGHWRCLKWKGRPWAAGVIGRRFAVRPEASVRAKRGIAPDIRESDGGKRRGHRNGASRRGSRASKDHLVRAGCRWRKTRCRSHRQEHEDSPENRRST